MGHHIDDKGEFKSDKYDWCPPGFIALKFTDPIARSVLKRYAEATEDSELADDIRFAIRMEEAKPDNEIIIDGS